MVACSEVISLQRPRLPKVKMVYLNSQINPDRRLYMGYIGFKENSSASSIYAKRLWGFGGFVCFMCGVVSCLFGVFFPVLINYWELYLAPSAWTFC